MIFVKQRMYQLHTGSQGISLCYLTNALISETKLSLVLSDEVWTWLWISNFDSNEVLNY